MRKQLARLSLSLLILAVILAACKKEEPLPTPIPTAIVPDRLPSQDDPTPIPEPADTPEPVAAVDPAAIDWPPQIVYSSPAPGEETLLDGAVTVRFDQPMDQNSVEAAFAIEPVVDGRFSWPRPDTLIFTPQSGLKRQQRYNVRIGENAKSANGMALQSAADLQLQTIGALEVSQVIPGDGATEIQTDGAITILFNRPVVPLVSSGQQANLPQPLTIEPAVAGEGEWVSTSIYRFAPDESFAGATTYAVNVAAGLEDVTGSVLADAYSWQFTTLRPSVVSIEPENETRLVDPEGAVTITFNMPMDRASTETAVSLRSAPASVNLIYGWSDDDRVLTVTPQRRLDLAANYQVGVAVSARSASGEANLDKDTISGFTTVPYPAVVFTNPGHGQLADQWQRGVSIQFASPMNWDTVEDHIHIEPQPTKANYNIYDRKGTELYLDFRLDSNAEYTVTIPGDAADPYGNTLGQDYTFSFRT
ncbi:MAG: Ig-like domain-containing protein, partial [Chloroflexi bacterium]|nr:Ig-like domain-containing protein [Chloroflexota bacterium]